MRSFWFARGLPRRVLLLSAVVLASQFGAPGGAASPRSQPPNIVLITLDTTRADHLGSYGWPHARTPQLDALARRGARFARCDTAAPITLPSHATILTGLYPPRHGARDNGTFVLDRGVETIASKLQAAGYDTAAVVSAIVLARRYGLDRGFRIYDDDFGPVSESGGEANERTADRTTAAALAALSKLRPPYFLWVHYFDPHEEYHPPARLADAAGGPNKLYDGEIAFVDEQLGELLSRIPNVQDSDVAVVADHGEMLGEHGEPTHGLLVNAAARRVPLILAGPDVPAGRTIPCLVRTADVAPTLWQWAGVSAPAGLDGASLLPLPEGAGCDRTTYTESFLPFFAYKWYPLRALSDGRSLFVHGPSPSLYALAADPAERRDLAARQPEAVATWERQLRDRLAASGEALEGESPSARDSDEHLRSLLSLGYVGGQAGGAITASLPDPRAMTAIARQLHDATKQIQAGGCDASLPRLREILRQDPHNFSAIDLTAQCLRDAEKYEDALALFRRAAQENPRSAVPVGNAAGCLLKLGRRNEAEEEFRRAVALDPGRAEPAANLARLLREDGDRKGALAVLDGALAAGSMAPTVLLERGLVLAESGRIADALASFQDAARRNPSDPLALANAARAAYRLQKYAEAARIYEQLLHIAPEADTWKTLGAIYLTNLNDPARSLQAFREARRLELDPAKRQELEQIVRELER